ncbi:hypothetical protein BDI4_680016 [Burkholderia diffusa]|nr:hypothetical protein BDI4_680016 [Burkholderia diffusa]
MPHRTELHRKHAGCMMDTAYVETLENGKVPGDPFVNAGH